MVMTKKWLYSVLAIGMVLGLIASTGTPAMAEDTSLAYRAIALQARCDSITKAKDAKEARAMMMKAIERLGDQVRASRLFVGRDVKLVVLPEYILTGFPWGNSIPDWLQKAALHYDGPEYKALGEIAVKNKIYLAGNAYEVDPNFPDIYFQTCFIIDPEGKVIYRYRRLNSMFAVTPHDVWDKYLEIYGIDGVFPVARTPIGNLAAIASEEILYPEVARCFALRGAEVFVHTNSMANEIIPDNKGTCIEARAIENMAYVISANTAGIFGTPFPAQATEGGSKVVDFKGHVLAKSGYGETMTANAEIDLAALRRYRDRPGMGNLLARQRLELYAPVYGNISIHPVNTMLEGVPEKKMFFTNHLQAIKKLQEVQQGK